MPTQEEYDKLKSLLKDYQNTVERLSYINQQLFSRCRKEPIGGCAHVYGLYHDCDETISIDTKEELTRRLIDDRTRVERYNYCPECGVSLKEDTDLIVKLITGYGGGGGESKTVTDSKAP